MADEVVQRRSVKDITKAFDNRQSLPITLKPNQIKMKDIIQRASLNTPITEDRLETEKSIEDTGKGNENLIEKIEANSITCNDIEIAYEALEEYKSENIKTLDVKEEVPNTEVHNNTNKEELKTTDTEIQKNADLEVPETTDLEVQKNEDVSKIIDVNISTTTDNEIPNDIYEDVLIPSDNTQNDDKKALVVMKCKLSLKNDIPCSWNAEKCKFEEHCKTVHPYEYSFFNTNSINWANIKVLQNTVTVRKYDDEIFWTYHKVINQDNKSMMYYAVLTEGNRETYFYSVCFYLRGNISKRLVLEESCLNINEDIENIFRCRRCIVIPTDMISNYFNVQEDLIEQIYCKAKIKKNTDRGFYVH